MLRQAIERRASRIVARPWNRRAYPVLAALLVASLCRTTWAASSCSVTSVTGVAFGSYDPLSGSPLDSVGSIGFTCTGLPLGISVNLSTGNSGTYAARELHSGANVLEYNLYIDPTALVIWGDGSQGSIGGPPILTLSSTLSVYGRIPAGQNVPAGIYSDTITATVLF